MRPSCIDADGNIIFENMGKYSTKKIPMGMNLYMGIDGNLYMRGDFYANDIYVENGTFNGTVYADKGRFTGDIEALDVRLKSGETFTSILNEQGKIKGDYIDAKGINIKDPSTGDTVLYMDATGIHWTAKYSPFKHQYATSATGPWHDTRSANDEYRRESTDGGTTWSDGIKFVAKDGRNGSDANVSFNNIKAALQKAASTQTSFITANEVGAPNIYGGNIYGAKMYTNLLSVYPDAENPAKDGQGIELYGVYENNPYRFLRIRYSPNLFWPTPGVVFESPSGGSASWNFAETKFNGRCDFSDASVTGIHLTLA